MRIGFVLALTCALALAVSACGGGDSDGTETSSGSVKPSEVSGEITVWDLAYGSFPGYDEAADALDAEFEEKYPNVTVKHVGQPYATYNQAYKAAFTARQGPDVMMMAGGVRGVLNYAPGLEVLNDRITPEMQEEIFGWEAVTPGNTVEGDHYGLPVATNSTVFYYNKELFAKAGLPREFSPTTWDELREAGEKLEAAGIQPFVGGNKEGSESLMWFSAGWQTTNTPEESIELSEGTMSFTDEAVTKAFEPLFMIQDAGLYPDDRPTTPFFPVGAAALGQGNGAIQIGNMSLVAYYNEYNPKLGTKNVGMFLPPGTKFVGTEPQYVWSIPSFTSNRDAAWAYISFLASREGIETLVDELRGELPSRNDVEIPADSPPQAFQALEFLQDNPKFIQSYQMVPTAAYEVLGPEINEVLQGRTSLEDAQQSMQEAVEKAAG